MLTGAARGGPPGPAEWSSRVCRLSVLMLAGSGAAVTATGLDRARRLVAASDFSTRALEDAQVTTWQGPSLDAADGDRPVLAPDLADGGRARWPAFTSRALARGAAAVFAFPLRVGASPLGVLTVYRGGPGMLTDDERRIADALAEAATDGLIDGARDDADTLGARLLTDGFAAQQALYQAQGMVMVDLRVTLVDALAHIRRHAEENQRTVSAVARDIVAGDLRLALPHGADADADAAGARRPT